MLVNRSTDDVGALQVSGRRSTTDHRQTGTAHLLRTVGGADIDLMACHAGQTHVSNNECCPRRLPERKPVARHAGSCPPEADRDTTRFVRLQISHTPIALCIPNTVAGTLAVPHVALVKVYVAAKFYSFLTTQNTRAEVGSYRSDGRTLHLRPRQTFDLAVVLAATKTLTRCQHVLHGCRSRLETWKTVNELLLNVPWLRNAPSSKTPSHTLAVRYWRRRHASI